MRRRLFTFGAALSLAFCIATLALWVLSTWTTLWIDWSPEGGAQYRINSDPAGMFYLSWDYQPKPEPRPFFHLKWDASYDYSPVNTGRECVHAFSVPVVKTRTNVVQMRLVLVPFGWLVAALAVLPAWYAGHAWKRLRRRCSGCCPRCGYDLRATPERCPECGAVPERAATAAT